MHVHLATVLSASSGVTGLAMLRALLAGARDPARLAAFKDDRLTARPHTLAKPLKGNGRAAWRCHLRQARARDACDQQHSAACDTQLAAHLLPVDRQLESSAPPRPSPQRRPQNAGRHEPPVDRHTPRSRLRGVDLTRLDGLEGLTAPTLMAELGLARSRWKRENHCASWRG
jgi:transposase